MESFEFEWDEKKNQTNISKHGISFEEAALVFTDESRETIADNRKDYGEQREIVIGKANIHDEIYIITVIYTERKNTYRIISARKANTKEKNIYYDYST